jgi:hypothetical protein
LLLSSQLLFCFHSALPLSYFVRSFSFPEAYLSSSVSDSWCFETRLSCSMGFPHVPCRN